MRIEITATGIYGQNGEIPVGTELTVKEEPTGWAGRYRVIADEKGKTPVINPLDHDNDGKSGGAKPNDPPSERDALKAQAAELGVEYPRNIATDKLKALIEDAKA